MHPDFSGKIDLFLKLHEFKAIFPNSRVAAHENFMCGLLFQHSCLHYKFNTFGIIQIQKDKSLGIVRNPLVYLGE